MKTILVFVLLIKAGQSLTTIGNFPTREECEKTRAELRAEGEKSWVGMTTESVCLAAKVGQ